ncbi:MAG: prepilin-type N-terminal cleavage/methylation domain-containing protein [Desulfobacteraceae bacterium]|nr:MAG: prepilin-type N-terminal cleavage/methylation domain-containing protein [Desulfobacteraceae bacterium]
MAGILNNGPADSRRGAISGGFSLIEVLVALSIVTIALTSVYRLQSDTFRMSADARFYTLAPLLAQSKLAEIERQGLKNAADGSGDFGADYPGYAWAVHMEDVRSDLLKDAKHNLTRIDLTVTQNEEMHFELRTYRFNAD